MLGGIIGDIVGSRFEWNNHRSEDFDFISEKCFFTDDTVLTIATADCLLSAGDYSSIYQTYARRYPNSGYGGRFRVWMNSDSPKPYRSFGNGSAMRVSPVGWFFPDLESTLKEARRSAEVTHDHREGIKGAESIAAAIFLARSKRSKQEIRSYIESNFQYNLDFSLQELQRSYEFDETCQGSVPQSIYCFLISSSFEDAIRKSISIGGDSDTIACITGSIAEAFYGEIPKDYIMKAKNLLKSELKEVLEKFSMNLKINENRISS